MYWVNTQMVANVLTIRHHFASNGTEMTSHMVNLSLSAWWQGADAKFSVTYEDICPVATTGTRWHQKPAKKIPATNGGESFSTKHSEELTEDTGQLVRGAPMWLEVFGHDRCRHLEAFT